MKLHNTDIDDVASAVHVDHPCFWTDLVLVLAKAEDYEAPIPFGRIPAVQAVPHESVESVAENDSLQARPRACNDVKHKG